MSDENKNAKDPVEVLNLDCAGGGCCPDAVINADRSVTLTEGVFAMTLRPESAAMLERLLRKHGYHNLG